jgi:hypothetical protein
MQQPVLFRHDPALLGEFALAPGKRGLARCHLGFARV